MLLVMLVALLVIDPLIKIQILGVSSSRILFSSVLLTAVWATGRSRRHLSIGLALVAPTLLLEWALFFWSSSIFLQMANLAFSGAFLVFVCSSIVRALFREEQVTRDTIAGGILVYLLLGVLWWVAYVAVEIGMPGAFEWDGVSVSAEKLRYGVSGFPELLYFSFVTLSTLGYGDITPEVPIAQSLSVLEAIIGQLFVAIFIARLVGLSLANRPDPGS